MDASWNAQTRSSSATRTQRRNQQEARPDVGRTPPVRLVIDEIVKIAAAATPALLGEETASE